MATDAQRAAYDKYTWEQHPEHYSFEQWLDFVEGSAGPQVEAPPVSDLASKPPVLDLPAPIHPSGGTPPPTVPSSGGSPLSTYTNQWDSGEEDTGQQDEEQPKPPRRPSGGGMPGGGPSGFNYTPPAFNYTFDSNKGAGAAYGGLPSTGKPAWGASYGGLGIDPFLQAANKRYTDPFKQYFSNMPLNYF